MDNNLIAVIAVIAFNLPILAGSVTVFRNRNAVGAALAMALREKDGTGTDAGSTSYSRVTGFMGAIIIASLFWILGNIVVAEAILDPARITLVLDSSGRIFLIGAALFLPYAFNQLKSIF